MSYDDIKKSITIVELLNHSNNGDEERDDEGKDPMYHPMKGSVGGVVYDGPHANKILNTFTSHISKIDRVSAWTGADQARLASFANVDTLPGGWYYSHLIRTFMFLATKNKHYVIAMITPNKNLLKNYQHKIDMFATKLLPNIAQQEKEYNYRKTIRLIQDAIDPNETYTSYFGDEYSGKKIRQDFIEAMHNWISETVSAYENNEPLPSAYEPEEALILDQNYEHDYIRDLLGDMMDDYLHKGGSITETSIVHHFEKLLQIPLS